MAVKIPVAKCREDIQLPAYKKQGDAGADVRAAQDIKIHPGETIIIPTGLQMAIPEGYEIQVRPRSGLSSNTPLRVSNSPGTIDCGYRDEIGVIIDNISQEYSLEYEMVDNIPIYPTYNLNSKGNKKGIYVIQKGERIAQLVLAKVETAEFEEYDSVKDIGSDRKSGFGQTGTT